MTIKNDSIVVDLTLEQMIAIQPLLTNVEDGKGSVIAQVYKDGIRMKVLSGEQTAAVAKILGASGKAPSRSAYEAQHKDLKNREAA